MKISLIIQVCLNHVMACSLLLPIIFLAACENPEQSYFPLEEGLHWRYKLSYETMDGPDETLYLIENLPRSEQDGEAIYTRRSLDGRLFHYQIRDEGLLMTDHEISVGRETEREISNHYVFQYPIEVGHKWQGTSRSRVLLKTGPPQKTEFRIVTTVPVVYEIEALDDQVNVPAGKFRNCMRISFKGSSFVNAGNYVGKTFVTIKETNWYAPGVGLVKSVRRESTTSNALDKGMMMLELEAFN